MMLRRALQGLLLTIIVTLPIQSKTVPSAVWSQKDVTQATHGDSSSGKKVLIAANKSDFKDSLLSNLSDSLVADSVYVKIIGLKQLPSATTKNWSAILILNTCVAWQMENSVQEFIKKNSTYRHFITFTSSGSPKQCWPSKKAPQGIDAFTSASTMDKQTAVTDTLMQLLRKHLH